MLVISGPASPATLAEKWSVSDTHSCPTLSPSAARFAYPGRQTSLPSRNSAGFLNLVQQSGPGACRTRSPDQIPDQVADFGNLVWSGHPPCWSQTRSPDKIL